MECVLEILSVEVTVQSYGERKGNEKRKKMKWESKEKK